MSPTKVIPSRSCPNLMRGRRPQAHGDRKGHCQEDIPEKENDFRRMTSKASLLAMLDQLPPSKEILEFYRSKLTSFEAEEKQWAERLAKSRHLVSRNVDLEKTVDAREREIETLQKAMVEMQTALAQERKRSARMEANLDKMTVQDMENREKLAVLLEICGKTDAEILRLITQGRKDRDPAGIFIPERIKDFLQIDKV